MNRLTIALFTALALAGCSGGGGGVAVPTAPTSPVHATAAVSLSLGAATAVGATTVYPLTVKATDSSGATISGPYLNAIALSTSDGTRTGFSSSSSGSNPSPTASVGSSTQAVYFVYSGSALTTAVTVTATSPTASPSAFIFQPGTAGGGGAAAVVSSLSIAANGAPSIVGAAGSFALTVAAYDVTGALITGTYPTALVVSSNDSADLKLSVNGGTAAGSVTVTSSSQIVVASYDGASVPGGTAFSVSSAGAPTVSLAFTPGSSSAGSVSNIASLTLAQIGSIPNVGTAGQFALIVTAYDSSNLPISGTYSQAVIVSTNDSTDLQLATTPNGPFTSSVSLSNSSTVVYVNYDGASVPATTTFAANSGTIQGVLGFNPAVRLSTAPVVNKLYITTAGAPPVSGTYGAQPIYIAAYDQNNNLLNGTFPSPIRVTTNNAEDFDLALDTYAPASKCELLPPTTPCPNVAAQVVTNSGQVVFGDYADSLFTGGLALPDISITTNGLACSAIHFPLVASGSTPIVCQAQNPAAPSSVARAGFAARLVPVASKH